MLEKNKIKITVKDYNDGERTGKMIVIANPSKEGISHSEHVHGKVTGETVVLKNTSEDAILYLEQSNTDIEDVVASTYIPGYDEPLVFNPKVFRDIEAELPVSNDAIDCELERLKDARGLLNSIIGDLETKKVEVAKC